MQRQCVDTSDEAETNMREAKYQKDVNCRIYLFSSKNDHDQVKKLFRAQLVSMADWQAEHLTRDYLSLNGI